MTDAPRTDPCPPIIGICGDIGSGKDSAAAALEERLGYVRMGFADGLKEWVADAFPWVPRCHLFGTQAEKSQTLYVADGIHWTGRKLLEHLGEAARQAYPDVWISQVMTRIDSSDPWRWVIPDVRHPNEFQAIWDRNGVVWEVVKVGGPVVEKSTHVSDNAWRRISKDATLTVHYGELEVLGALAMSLALDGGKNART